MKTELTHSLTSTFEAEAQPIDEGAPTFGTNPRRCAAHGLDGRFVTVNKTIDAHCAEHEGRLQSSTFCARAVSVNLNIEAIDASVITTYRHEYIRPLAVRPLNYPEREPTPGGFLFFAPASSTSFPLTELCA